MAFGDIRGTKTGNGTSVTASNACATGTLVVSVNDIIVAAFAEQLTVTVTACTDSLGNTYTALGAGADAGAVTGRAFYTRVTNPGTISQLTFAATASSNNYACAAVGFEGPFAASPIDAAPAGILNDLTTPYTCPPTGVLAQADEKIVNVIVHNGNPTFTATAPNLKAIDVATASILKVAIGHQTVASTASVTPAWTASVTPTAAGNDTVSFKKVAPTPGDGDADGIAGATGDGGAINTTPGTAGGVAAATAVGEAASIYSTEANQFFARTTGLTSERKALLNTYINALVAGGVWAKLQVHYLFAAPDAATAIINLKSSSFPGTVNGSPTFSADVGFTNPTSGTTTHFIDTGYNPSVHGAQDDQHVSIWNSSNQAQVAAVMGCKAAASELVVIYPKSVGNTATHIVNASGGVGFSIGDPRGLHIASSDGSGSEVGYFNGVQQATGGTTGTPPNANIYVLAYNNNGTAQGGTFQLRSASIGTLLTAAEATAFFDAEYAFLAALVENIFNSVGSATGVAAASGVSLDPYTSGAGSASGIAAAAAEGRCIVPTASAGGGGDWTAVYAPADSRNINPGWAGYTIVGTVPLAGLSATGGTQGRITFASPWGGEPAEYSAFYIGNGGGADPYDFGDTPVQVKVGGSGTISLPVSDFNTVVSDAFTFTKDAVNPLVFAAQFENASADNLVYMPGGTAYYGGASQAALADKSGYLSAGLTPFLFKLELFIGGAAGVAGVGGALAVGAIGEPAVEAAGSAIGVGAAAAATATIISSVGAAPGVGAAAAIGQQFATVAGAISGIGAATGNGAKIATTSGAVAGVGTATAVTSAAAFVSGAGTAAGIGAAAATGGKIATASGSAVGLGIASGSSSAAAFVSAVGTASGIGFASATGFAHSAAAAGTAAGLGAAAATGQKIAVTTGAVAGTGAATASSGAINAAAGAASGIGAAAATGFEAAVVFEEAAGSANAIGIASGIGFAILPSATPGDRVTVLPFSPRSGSLPASMRGAAVAGSRRVAAVAAHDRIAIVPRRDRAA